MTGRSDRDLELVKIEAMQAITEARDRGLELVITRMDTGRSRALSNAELDRLTGLWPAGLDAEPTETSDAG